MFKETDFWDVHIQKVRLWKQLVKQSNKKKIKLKKNLN